ncbi:MAG: DnaJ domain-containing protein [Desulfobulbaceae bacterium]|nr:DnaJ domain-containing protein [Desulfobulbaceae bacterium]
MKYKDYYKTLDLTRKASADEIKQAYRRLARKYHPDINKSSDAEQKFKELGEAYEVLKDPEKRKAYDAIGSNYQTEENFTPPPEWNTQFSFHRANPGEFKHGFSDFFEELFGGGQFHTAQRRTATSFRARGEDIHAEITISLQEAYEGATKNITLNRPQFDQQGHSVLTPHTLHITIPKGILQGQRIRLEGQGGGGYGGAVSGDLYLKIRFAPHSLFTIKERDIYLDLPITCYEAALGAIITVPTLAGKVDVKIPPGSQGGSKLRLKGRGLSSNNKIGHQYIELHIVVPTPVTKEQKELFSKMAQVMPLNPRNHL